MIPRDLLKALSQLGDPRFLGILTIGIASSFALLVGLTLGLQFLLPDTISLPWIGEVGWLSSVLSGFVLLASIGASVFLMVPVAGLFLGFMLEPIAHVVERRHYPEIPQPPARPIRETIFEGLRLAVLLIVLNIFALVIYLLSTLLAPVIFWIVNGLLLGREYFQTVAQRHLGRAGADALRKRYRLRIWLAGILMAIPLSIPILNLLIPFLGVASFTHMFHRLNRSGKTLVVPDDVIKIKHLNGQPAGVD